MRFIGKSFLVAVVLFAAYNVVVCVLPRGYNARPAGPTMRSQNRVKAERYVGYRGLQDVVIAGSSVSEAMGLHIPGWTNLAFIGEGPMTGLEIIKKSESFPRVVLVEVNFINRRPEGEMVRGAAGAIPRVLRRYLPALREENRPRYELIRLFTADDATPALSPDAALPQLPPLPGYHLPRPGSVFEAQVAKRRSELAKPLTPDEEKDFLKAIHYFLTPVEKKHTFVCFFETPEYPDSMMSPNRLSYLEILHREFPSPQYGWLPRPDATRYETTDAVHLPKAYIPMFDRFLEDAFNKVDREHQAWAAGHSQ